MRLVVASDKFAGTLTATEACAAIGAGWLDERPRDEVRSVPMADGGPGTVDVVAATGRGTIQTSDTINQRGHPMRASWLSLGDDVALIEVCAACGLDLVPAGERLPTESTSEGVGRLLADVSDRGYREVIVGLGGSGTVDGGLGAAIGMGATALDEHGEARLVRGPIDYDVISSVTPVSLAPPKVLAATDVSNPLLGPHGAARVFGPQKGADLETVELLEIRLAQLADVVERSLPGGPWRDVPGAGSAGGLGFGLMAWLGAGMTGGAELIADLVDLERHLQWADVAITGEGSLDAQTSGGKAPAFVADLANSLGRPVAAVAGRVASEATARFDVVEELGETGMTDPHGSARRAAARLAREWSPDR